MEIIKCTATDVQIGEFPDGTLTVLTNAPDGVHDIIDVVGTTKQVWMYNGSPFDKDYGDSSFITCEGCGKIIDSHTEWGYVDIGNGILCEDCRDERLDYCEICNEWHERGQVVLVQTMYGEETWCLNCVARDAFTCPDCGKLTATSYSRGLPRKTICRNCYANNYLSCAECGRTMHRNDLVQDEETGRYFCQDCMNAVLEERNRLVECTHCHTSIRNGDVLRVRMRMESGTATILVCGDCYSTHAWVCTDCGRAYITGEQETELYLHDGRRICRNCADRHTFVCPDCGERYHRASGHTHERVMYCPRCESRHRPVRVITGYHHYNNNTPVWVFRSLKEVDVFKDLFMGIELEIDGGGENNNKAIQITTALGYSAQDSNEFKCTTDGSLNDGFEIISMPATYEYHLTKYDWDAGMKKAASLGYSSHDANTCGLHIHVNRSYFTQSIENPETSTVLLMCNNRGWLEKFSRRTRWGYCDFKGDRRTFKVEDFKTTNRQNDSTETVLRSIVSDCHGHGCMVNFGNHATIEFRLFRGTLKHKTFVATLQLVKMMCYAIKHFRKEQLTNVDLRWFKKYATNNNYTEFLEYLDSRGIMI